MRAKPDPAIVLEALRQLGLSAEEGIYVGDTEIDMRTALNAGMTAIGVTTGNHDAAALKSSGAEFVISSLRQLPDLWEDLHGKE